MSKRIYDDSDYVTLGKLEETIDDLNESEMILYHEIVQLRNLIHPVNRIIYQNETNYNDNVKKIEKTMDHIDTIPDNTFAIKNDIYTIKKLRKLNAIIKETNDNLTLTHDIMSESIKQKQSMQIEVKKSIESLENDVNCVHHKKVKVMIEELEKID